MDEQQPRTQQSERVPDMILDSGLPDRELVGSKPRLQCVRAKRAGSHTSEHQHGGERQRNSWRHLRYNGVAAPRRGVSVVQDSTMFIERRPVGKCLSDLVVNPGAGAAFFAGQGAADPKSDIVGQTEQVLAQIDSLLHEAGSDRSHLLSATIYLPDIADFAAMNAVWEKWVVAGATPARATVQAVLAAPEYKVEIQVVAR